MHAWNSLSSYFSWVTSGKFPRGKKKKRKLPPAHDGAMNRKKKKKKKSSVACARRERGLTVLVRLTISPGGRRAHSAVPDVLTVLARIYVSYSHMRAALKQNVTLHAMPMQGAVHLPRAVFFFFSCTKRYFLTFPHPWRAACNITAFYLVVSILSKAHIIVTPASPYVCTKYVVYARLRDYHLFLPQKHKFSDISNSTGGLWPNKQYDFCCRCE